MYTVHEINVAAASYSTDSKSCQFSPPNSQAPTSPDDDCILVSFSIEQPKVLRLSRSKSFGAVRMSAPVRVCVCVCNKSPAMFRTSGAIQTDGAAAMSAAAMPTPVLSSVCLISCRFVNVLIQRSASAQMKP